MKVAGDPRQAAPLPHNVRRAYRCDSCFCFCSASECCGLHPDVVHWWCLNPKCNESGVTYVPRPEPTA